MDYSNKTGLPEELKLRNYADNDYMSVEQFWNENGLGGKHRGDTAGIILDTINSGGHLLLMCDKSGRVIGTSWLTNDKRRTYLHHFGIAKEHRGKGFSKILLDASMQLAFKDGFQVKIEVHRENEIALNLYKKAGFKYLGDYDVYIIRELPEK